MLLININGSTKVDIEDLKTKNYLSINLVPFTGITLPKDTVCNLNFIKNSVSLQIFHQDKNLDIEKLK